MQIASLFTTLLVVVATCALVVEAGENSGDHRRVTCGAALKLRHVATDYRLHSHEVAYGSGSGQQSVTSFPRPDDPNGLFLVLQANGAAPCSRGTPVRCDSTIRLRHVATRNYLHSHREHASPLSQQQEVSAYVGGDDGDNWVVKCIAGGGGDHWMRDAEVELVHAVTGRYLHASKDYTFRNPIPGQLEVCASTRSSRNTKWATGEGIYFSDNPTFS